jgi:two-component system OmpR family sensor kinase/two-component system sensor histidine kinase BaeS
MLRSLFFRLLGAFALVILVMAVVVAVSVNRSTNRQFQLYSNRTGQLLANQLAPQLAAFYTQQGGWQGVETVLAGSAGMMGSGMMNGGQMGPGMMSGTHMPGTTNVTGLNMWSMMGLRAILADAGGRVISDSADQLTGQTLSAPVTTLGVPIRVDSQSIGTVLVAWSDVSAEESSAGAFLRDLNRSILLAVLAAGVIALVLGGLLFFELTAPIRRLTAAALAISAGDLSQRVVVGSRDEVGELAGAFNTMAENLAAAEGQRRQMVADVAHELRTPLSVIQANVEAMQDGVLPADAEQLASLHDETLLLSRLVADLRLISLAEAGQLKLERTEVDLSELMRKATERMRPAAHAKGIVLQAEVPPSAPLIADPGRLNQVVGNLVENALRNTPAGGAVTLQVNSAIPDRARLPALQTGANSYLVTITDTGAGIAPEDLPHVFDRFYRVDKSRARASGGSGLGLAIVRHLVEAHGGQVWAESPVYHAATDRDYGTRVSFTLPVAA